MPQKILTHMTMSLDGYIATPTDGVDHIFDWYGAGDVPMSTASPDINFKLDQASAEMMRDLIGNAGALIAGRRLFDITKGWGDNHPIGTPVVVVTHEPLADAAKKWPRTTFVNSVEEAVARARRIAGNKNVIISSANILQQAIALGLVDEICISVAPVLLGKGIPYFSTLPQPLMLEDPVVTQGHRALHLRYPVRH